MTSTRPAAAGWFLPAIAAIAVLGVGASLLATPRGIGVTPDSVVYLAAADSLRVGLGFVAPDEDGVFGPVTHYPPLYPATLAATMRTGLEGPQAARLVAMLCAGANIVLVALAVLMFTGAPAAAALAGLGMAVSLDMLFLNTAAWSDAQFIALAFGCLLAVAAYLQGRGRRYLAIGALAGALAWLGRYVGGSVVMSACLLIMVLGPGRRAARLAAALCFGAVAAAPTGLWMLHNARASGTATHRSFSLSLVSTEHLAAMLQTMTSWLLPGTNRLQVVPWQDAVTTIAFLIATAALVVAMWWYVLPGVRAGQAVVGTPIVFACFAVVYLAAVLAATSLFDRNVPMDNRMLAPAYVSSLVVVSCVLTAAARSLSSGPRRAALLTVVGGWLLAQTVVSAGAAAHFIREGRGLVGPAWEYHAIEPVIAGLDPDMRVYSNHPMAVAFLFGRAAHKANPRALTRTLARGEEVVLVFFENPRAYAPRHPQAEKETDSSPAFLRSLLSGGTPALLAEERNARVYRLAPAGADRPPDPRASRNRLSTIEPAETAKNGHR